MSRKRPTYDTTEDVFRHDLKALDKRLERDIEEALDRFTQRVEQTLRQLRDRLRAAS